MCCPVPVLRNLRFQGTKTWRCLILPFCHASVELPEWVSKEPDLLRRSGTRVWQRTQARPRAPAQASWALGRVKPLILFILLRHRFPFSFFQQILFHFKEMEALNSLKMTLSTPRQAQPHPLSAPPLLHICLLYTSDAADDRYKV